MFKKILLVLVVLIAAFCAFVVTRPAEFSVTRSALIPGKPETVFPLVNDFHQWKKWSPWAKLDPNTKETFSGAEQGQGASFAWEGNSKVGQGSMTITESKPNERIRMGLEFIKPFKATNATEFTFQPQDGQTLVTWTMSGRNGFLGKAVAVAIDCDKMIGDSFEEGLASMKTVVESETAP